MNKPKTLTPAAAHAYLDAAGVLRDAIAAAGADGVPAGHLYAFVAGQVDLGTFEMLIELLVDAGKVTRSGHLLTVRA